MRPVFTLTLIKDLSVGFNGQTVVVCWASTPVYVAAWAIATTLPWGGGGIYLNFSNLRWFNTVFKKIEKISRFRGVFLDNYYLLINKKYLTYIKQHLADILV